MTLRAQQDRKERNLYVSQQTHTEISDLLTAAVDEEHHAHCENQIGAVVIPLGVAGPLQYTGSEGSYSRYIPLATTEGALVASVARGCKAISFTGAVIDVDRIGTTRGPVFSVQSLEQRRRLTEWVQTNKDSLAQLALTTSSHIKLLDVTTRGTADYVFMRFTYDTSEAMGMNMVTIATQRLIEEIEQQTGANCLSVAGNYDIDKKPAWLNSIMGRGRTVWAESMVPHEVLEKVLKTTAQNVFDVWLSKCMIGSAMAGSIGFNAHYANIIAAFYAATGQDLAHVVEGSAGVTTARVVEEGLYIAVYLPSVMVGIVGGGTKLKTQSQARAITNCQSSDQLAELLGGAVLAGELSLLSSLSVGSLASSHTKLGR
ncbi:MAG: 3-hydroxy-3-methylglutaryl-CoA reductase [Patescibacteria group bacterium]